MGKRKAKTKTAGKAKAKKAGKGKKPKRKRGKAGKAKRPGSRKAGAKGAQAKKKAGEIQYSSPSYLEISCPRCGSPNTKAQGSKGPIQRRICLAPTCRHPFKVARRRILAQEV